MKLRLRELREFNELTQKNLAEYLHISQQTYSKYETGDLTPSLQDLEHLSVFYNTSVDFIMGLTNQRAKYKDIPPKKHF